MTMAKTITEHDQKMQYIFQFSTELDVVCTLKKNARLLGQVLTGTYIWYQL